MAASHPRRPIHVQTPRPHGACRLRRPAAGCRSQAQTTRLTITQDGAGTLFVGNGAPGDKQVKIEVGPLAGQVRVIDGAAPAALAFSGIRAIRLATGAGTDQIELDMHASQSLALSIDSGAGDANIKLQWKVPPGAASTVSSLDMASGGGRLTIELDHASETREASFQWTTRFGGGDKLIKGGIAFREGVQLARQNIAFTQLGGGTHLVNMDVENKAADATLVLNTGSAQDVQVKVLSPDRTVRLVTDTTVAGAKNGIGIQSMATNTACGWPAARPRANGRNPAQPGPHGAGPARPAARLRHPVVGVDLQCRHRRAVRRIHPRRATHRQCRTRRDQDRDQRPAHGPACWWMRATATTR